MNYAALLIAALVSLGVAGSTGWSMGAKSKLADWNAEKLALMENARLLKKASAATQRKIDDDLTTALVAHSDLARDADERLRLLAAKYRREHAGGAKCRDDAPPAARLSDQTRADLIQLARDANACAAALQAWQRRESLISNSKETP